MINLHRRRRLIVVGFTLIVLALSSISFNQSSTQVVNNDDAPASVQGTSSELAINALSKLDIKGRASDAGYSRAQFGEGWETNEGCDTRNTILYRDLKNVTVDENCNVTIGSLEDPYTGKVINFKRGSGTSGDVQIDHVVALSDAWQKGAQQMTRAERIVLANDPLELLAVDGGANQQKSGSDAASWLPSNKPFRCQYVARQIAVKIKYKLWVTSAEYNAIKNILSGCSYQTLPK